MPTRLQQGAGIDQQGDSHNGQPVARQLWRRSRRRSQRGRRLPAANTSAADTPMTTRLVDPVACDEGNDEHGTKDDANRLRVGEIEPSASIGKNREADSRAKWGGPGAR